MDAGLSVESIIGQQAALTRSALGMGVVRKVLDMAQAEGADLARLIDSSGGVGRNIDTSA